MRWFNTAGPCTSDHFIIPPERRLPGVDRLIAQKAYFVVHAPRQVGKTTAIFALARRLTEEGHLAAAVVSVEVGAAFADDIGGAEGAILGSWEASLSARLPAALQPKSWPVGEAGSRIRRMLKAWAETCSRPIVLFIDEIDALRGDALVAVLRQLRDGYADRPTAFPWSVGLIGLRDVRDYVVDDTRLGTASPFNVKVESLTMRDFDASEVAFLYGQHTEETGQTFTPEAIALAFDLTRGQPWLVNAIARQLVEVVVPDRATPISTADVDRAREILLARRDTHLDSLAERLREPRVRGVIEPILAGGSPGNVPPDDVRYVEDLGLVHQTLQGGLEVANPIYREVIPTVLAANPRAFLPQIAPSWLRPDGALDPRALLVAFLAFWRQHGEPLMKSAPYHEIAPHLVLMAFLHRVANGGGTLEREYAIGAGRMDLCLRYGAVTLGIELKVWREGQRDPADEGLAQLDRYLDGLASPTPAEGWLVVFDRRPIAAPIGERTSAVDGLTPDGRAVQLVRA